MKESTCALILTIFLLVAVTATLFIRTPLPQQCTMPAGWTCNIQNTEPITLEIQHRTPVHNATIKTRSDGKMPCNVETDMVTCNVKGQGRYDVNINNGEAKALLIIK